MELRGRCQEERRRFVDICREYLNRSFKARQAAAQSRVMDLRRREISQPEVAIVPRRAENELTDLERTWRERLASLDRLTLVKHGPVRHVASALVLPVAEVVVTWANSSSTSIRNRGVRKNWQRSKSPLMT